MMTPREVARKTVAFERPDRLARAFPEPYGNDFYGAGMNPSPDARPRGDGVDEWGAVWHNIGVCKLGEVKAPPLKSWEDFDRFPIPDVEEPRRWAHLGNIREQAGDRYLLCSGVSIYERVHFIRGLENTWMDIYTNPGELRRLIDILVDMNLKAIDRYGRLGGDGFIFCDDWGLQDRLMIQPDKWREIWKPAYAAIYGAAHEAGLQTFLHSCGYILDILPDLIEIGLDVIQMDQQENMGLDALAAFAGRITFWCPVDIQTVMCRGTTAEIRAYCRTLVERLGTPEGGFLPKWYGDPQGAGHRPEAVEAMCSEFLRIEV
jgi:hypothetical protein